MHTKNIFNEFLLYGLTYLAQKNMLNCLSDEKFINIKYRLMIGKKADLENPTTYPEKLQWLKLHNRKDIYHTMVDKCDVKTYVANTIGEEYVIPLLGVWDSFDEIDFDKLPDKFVLKPSHASGGVFVCTDKNSFNYKKARKKLNKYLSYDYYNLSREWPYKGLKRRIIAEKYMIDESGTELKDYKFYCFNGEPKYVLIATDRSKGVKFDYFDMDFKHLDVMPECNAEVMPSKPKNYDKMVELAAKLSKDIPHVRVDFYNCDGKIYFGELTFFDSGGFEDKREWDKTFGDYINLENVK